MTEFSAFDTIVGTNLQPQSPAEAGVDNVIVVDESGHTTNSTLDGRADSTNTVAFGSDAGTENYDFTQLSNFDNIQEVNFGASAADAAEEFTNTLTMTVDQLDKVTEATNVTGGGATIDIDGNSGSAGSVAIPSGAYELKLTNLNSTTPFDVQGVDNLHKLTVNDSDLSDLTVSFAADSTDLDTVDIASSGVADTSLTLDASNSGSGVQFSTLNFENGVAGGETTDLKTTGDESIIVDALTMGAAANNTFYIDVDTTTTITDVSGFNMNGMNLSVKDSMDGSDKLTLGEDSNRLVLDSTSDVAILNVGDITDLTAYMQVGTDGGTLQLDHTGATVDTANVDLSGNTLTIRNFSDADNIGTLALGSSAEGQIDTVTPNELTIDSVTGTLNNTLSINLKSKETIKTLIFNVTAFLFIFFVPAISHLIMLPVYYIEPMRIMLILMLLHTTKTNAYIIALALPAFSFIFSGHPVPPKMLLITAELTLNVFLFFFLVNKIKSTPAALITSIIGIVAYAGMMQGFWLKWAYWYHRVVLGVAALLLFVPNFYADAAGIALLVIVTILNLRVDMKIEKQAW